MVPFISSFRLVQVLLLPPPHAATSAAVNVSNAIHTPNRLPGILNCVTSSRNFFCSGLRSPRLGLPLTLRSPFRRIVGPRLPHGPRRVGCPGDWPEQDGGPRPGV